MCLPPTDKEQLVYLFDVLCQICSLHGEGAKDLDDLHQLVHTTVSRKDWLTQQQLCRHTPYMSGRGGGEISLTSYLHFAFDYADFLSIVMYACRILFIF